MFRLPLLLLFLCSGLIWSQNLIINEFDSDNPGSDTEEFIELKSQTPNFSTDGYILVFYNGRETSQGNNLSYLAIDLNGYTTDNNGLLVLGNIEVSPFPQVVLNNGLFQNGPDAVAIYQASIDDFPPGTPVTQNNLVDALVYGTNDAEDDLVSALGVTEQVNEGAGNNTNSIQRLSDGTYIATAPTPRRFNEGATIINPVEIIVSESQYDEGDTFTISFVAEENVSSDLTFNISLDNEGFNNTDFSGATSITIPNGQNSASTIINLLDDSDNEGDEVLKIQFLDLVEPIVPSNNLVEIRVVDNDFTVAAFGTPVDATSGNVSSTQPNGYYDSLNGLAGNDLRQALQDIVADPNIVRAHSYADVIDILKEADQNPLNSNEVWLVYTEMSRPKLDFQTTSNSTGKWNREHTFPRSRGGYNNWSDFDDIADGINLFITTEADSLRHANSDAHALRAADGSENSRRGNRHYSNSTYDDDEYNGPADINNNGSWKGDVARSVLYLELRYNGLSIVNGFPDITGQMGDLSTLLQWHADDSPDDFEMNRNNIIYDWQRNRNPLIDMPSLVDYLWGSRVGETWFNTLSTLDLEEETILVYPNPTTGELFINGLCQNAKLKLLTTEGRQLKQISSIDNKLDLQVAPGIYLLQIECKEKYSVKRIIIK